MARAISGHSARFLLRDATAQWHARVDAVFSEADLADRAGYGQFLRAQAAAYLPTERALDARGVDHVVGDWPARRRAHLLCEDLATLGQTIPPLEAIPLFEGTPAMLGALYVLEGSRLGGEMLRRSVPATFPQAFLSGGGTAAWRTFILALDVRLVTTPDLEAAIAAACATFALFEQAGRQWLGNST